MSPEEFKNRMKEIDNIYKRDLEAKHSKMDELMCALLISLGYQDGIQIFQNTELWYA